LQPLRNLASDELVDREMIRDCLLRYCRGVDRCDLDLIHAAYWPEATDLHATPGRAPMNAYAMFAKIMPRLQKMDQTMHTLANIMIRVAGAKAFAESYFHAYHRVVVDDGARRDIVTAGRYIDHLEKRAGEWRILHRVVALDWFRDHGNSADWEQGIFGGPCLMGGRKPDDMSYGILAALGFDT
jgi:hypothetical protein